MEYNKNKYYFNNKDSKEDDNEMYVEYNHISKVEIEKFYFSNEIKTIIDNHVEKVKKDYEEGKVKQNLETNKTKVYTEEMKQNCITGKLFELICNDIYKINLSEDIYSNDDAEVNDKRSEKKYEMKGIKLKKNYLDSLENVIENIVMKWNFLLQAFQEKKNSGNYLICGFFHESGLLIFKSKKKISDYAEYMYETPTINRYSNRIIKNFSVPYSIMFCTNIPKELKEKLLKNKEKNNGKTFFVSQK